MIAALAVADPEGDRRLVAYVVPATVLYINSGGMALAAIAIVGGQWLEGGHIGSLLQLGKRGIIIAGERIAPFKMR